MAQSRQQWTFDEDYWAGTISKPDWYMEFVPYAKKIHESIEPESEQFNQFNKTVRQFFEKALLDGKVALPSSGPDLDEQRQPIDTLVIHHTSNQPGYRLSYLNATHLINIYAPYFTSPTDERERELKGQPLWSGHFKGGKQVFWGYHWFMRMDGTFQRLLDDDQIGWHAGNWDINKRSIGICLDNDYDNQDPAEDILRKLAAFINQHYSNKKIIGHCEARQGTTCPGKNFLDGWKKQLIGFIVESK